MEPQTIAVPIRRPRFRRASEPPAFRLTDDDIEIIRHVARNRFMRSTHIATLTGRSLDRVNDRLCHLYHAGYIDRPRAQLDYYATTGSAPMVYALADRGARLLVERDRSEFANVEWSRKNRSAGRAYIEHQLEIVEFRVGLHRAAAGRSDVRLIQPEDVAATVRERGRDTAGPFVMTARISHKGATRTIGVVPDLVFGLALRGGARRWFMVEIDRGTMPVTRSDPDQTSVERKMRAYLSAHAAKQHQQKFGWKTFRVLVITTDEQRMRSMQEVLRRPHVPHSIGSALFLFATRPALHASDPFSFGWYEGTGRIIQLID